MPYPDDPDYEPTPAEIHEPGDPFVRSRRMIPPATSDPRGPLACPICWRPQSVCTDHTPLERTDQRLRSLRKAHI